MPKMLLPLPIFNIKTTKQTVTSFDKFFLMHADMKVVTMQSNNRFE